MFEGRFVKGMLVGVLIMGSVGCASTRQEPKIAHVTYAGDTQPDVVANFRRWLLRDGGLTQEQRLRRIERDWVGQLTQLSPSERQEAVAAIEANIRLRRLQAKRQRVVRLLLANTNETLAEATFR